MPYTGKVFSFQHNWAQPLKERLQLPCDVQVADDGTEQRRSLRLHPLRSYEFSVLVNGPSRAYFDAFLSSSLTEEVLLPIRHDGIRLGASLPSGSTSLSFDTSYLDLDADAYFLFWRDYKTYEAVQITDVTPTGIEFEETDETWPIGTKAFPARLATFDPNVQGVTIVNGVKSRRVKFDISPRSVSANRYGDFTWPTLDVNGDGNPITLWLTRSETSEETSDSIVHDAGIERTLTGIHSAFETRKIAPYNTFGFRQITNTRAELAEWVSFWKSRYGRRLPFWMPTWEKDFIPVSNVFGTLTWQENGYTEFYNLRPDRSRIYIQKTDGTASIGLMQSCTNNGDGTETGYIGDLTSTPNISRLSFLRYCRMESDALDIDWFTAGKASSQTTFRELFKVP